MKTFWQGFEKRAFTSHLQVDPGLMGAAGGLASGYSSGRAASRSASNTLSHRGSKTKNEEIANTAAKVTSPLGALIGLALGYKHKGKITQVARKHLGNHPVMNQLYEGVIPFATGTVGGTTAGALTGALTSLRGRKKEAQLSDEAKGALTYGVPGAGAGAALGLMHGGNKKQRAASAVLNALGLGTAGADIGINLAQLKKQKAIEKKL